VESFKIAAARVPNFKGVAAPKAAVKLRQLVCTEKGGNFIQYLRGGALCSSLLRYASSNAGVSTPCSGSLGGKAIQGPEYVFLTIERIFVIQ
jgi:hypothetical protein